MRLLASSSLALLGVLGVTARASAQCTIVATGASASVGSTDGLFDLCALRSGDVLAGGSLQTIGGVTVNGIARWNGIVWSALGAGVSSPSTAFVVDIVEQGSGDIVVGGSFAVAGAVPASNVARWNGVAWSALGAGLGDTVYALAILPNGDVVAGGTFTSSGATVVNHIARWNGVSWLPLGVGLNGAVMDLRVLSNGDLIAAGAFTTAGGSAADRIARWDGTAWSPLGAGMNSIVYRVVELPNGDLVAGGAFSTAGGSAANRVARWNGSGWSALGSGVGDRVYALAALPDGDVLVGGRFFNVGPLPIERLARWDGASWSSPLVVGAAVEDLVTLPDGRIAIGADDVQSPAWFEVIATTCPATAVPSGAGCAGSAGLNELTPRTLPWTGATYRARASGFTANTIALEVTGFAATAVPLAALLPQGVAGCTQWASADALRLHVPAGGGFDTQLPIPNAVALAGVVLHSQVLAAELTPQNAIAAVTATNALVLTVGTF